MKKSLLDDFRRYLEAQLALREKRPRPQLPAVTISREAGAGAITIGHLVAKILDQRCPGDPACPWAVFERNLVEKILQDHDLPAALERFMPEDATFPLNDAVETFAGTAPLVMDARGTHYPDHSAAGNYRKRDSGWTRFEYHLGTFAPCLQRLPRRSPPGAGAAC